MARKNRTAEASGLRTLFNDQWQRLQGLFAAEISPPLDPQQKQSLDKAVEDVVSGTDKRLRIISNYHKRLRKDVHYLLDHISNLVASVPGPFTIEKNAFNEDPNLHTFFVNADEMLQFFSQDESLHKYLQTHEAKTTQDIYALLCMNKQLKRGFGVGQAGETLVHDTQTTHLNFNDHQLYKLETSEADIRSALKQCLFYNYVRMISEETDKISLLEVASASAYLDQLSELLRQPEARVTIEKNTLKVNRMGLVMPSHEAVNNRVSAIDLHEVQFDNLSSRTILLVKIPKSSLLPPTDFLKVASQALNI
ncbi:MAG: hypothetical protein GY934_13695 [Gammaproteobacteria bacterium]|nr:hypothetical protein [Gammaproteobacteria bacterium]